MKSFFAILIQIVVVNFGVQRAFIPVANLSERNLTTFRKSL